MFLALALLVEDAIIKITFEDNIFSLLLTAFFYGFVTPVRTVSDLVAHFAHLDTLPAATLELLWPVTLSHWREIQRILHVKGSRCLHTTFFNIYIQYLPMKSNSTASYQCITAYQDVTSFTVVVLSLSYAKAKRLLDLSPYFLQRHE